MSEQFVHMEDYRLLGCNAVQSDALQMAAVESSAQSNFHVPDQKTSQETVVTLYEPQISGPACSQQYQQLHTVHPTTTIGPWNPVLINHTARVNKIPICKTDFSGLGNRHLPPHLALFISNYLNWFSRQRE